MRTTSYIFFGVAALTVIYSIIDAYTDIISFNNLFEIGYSLQYSNNPSSINNPIISLIIGL